MDERLRRSHNPGMRTSGAGVEINLGMLRGNVATIARRTGVPVLAVVKGDAYGLGIERVTDAIADLVAGWCVFRLDEAIEAQLATRTGKRTLTIGPAEPARLRDYEQQRVTPGVASVESAAALRPVQPALNVDLGMQRFACPPEQIDAVLAAGGCREAFGHATRMEHVERLATLAGRRGLMLHAAGSALLEQREAWLDAVRPGLAMYVGCVRVTAPLLEVRDTDGPAGYTGFQTRRHGVIGVGYSNGLRRGPCLVGCQRTQILEVGMQSAYIDLSDSNAKAGDEVVLLGDDLWVPDIAPEWHTSPQEVLLHLVQSGPREYVG